MRALSGLRAERGLFHGRIQRGQGVHTPEKSQKYRGFSNTGLDHLKNHKATKSAYNVWPSSARRPMVARLKWYFDPLSPHQLKKEIKRANFDPI